MSTPFLELYDPLDVIGNGSFGIIRKVRRKTDGLIFARKELNFERMSERDRKQIVAEVNILKDLHHDHIVRYHDRHVDRDAGILYIMMEYCGGGDLSTIIKQAAKHNRPIPEDTIWNYFMQILLALQHCHHPNGHGRSGSGVGIAGGLDSDGKERRAQILHRDLKPDNVFLDEANTVKLGDFGLSKALVQASFANTYVGTPYYMSPELMQEKAYDSKSDIWSLGCLIYELCALKPPFHEAKTHAELSILIRNGRIPPLPKGYSQGLTSAIKAMLNLNPAMRPSAAQLLQHERLELVFKVTETEKMLQTVKTHKATIISREREVLAREQALLEREQQLATALAQKDNDIASLQHIVAQHQQQYSHSYTQHDMERAVREAIAKREDELRVLVSRREEEVAAAMARREEEIILTVNKREAELCEAWAAREQQINQEVEEKIQWIQQREKELGDEESRLQSVTAQLEERARKWEEKSSKGRKEKTPLEEVKNILEPVSHLKHDFLSPTERTSAPPPRSPSPFPALATPAPRQTRGHNDYMPSAMKGVILTTTGEVLSTPAPGGLATLFVNSPKVGLNFTRIFDFETPEGQRAEARYPESEDEGASPPPSPSSRKEKQREEKLKEDDKSKERDRENSDSSSASSAPSTSAPPPTRIRRPSIRTSSRRPTLKQAATLPASHSDPTGLCASSSVTAVQPQPKPLPHPHLQTAVTAPLPTLRKPAKQDSPEYDLLDEENLPSPFLKRIERAGSAASTARSMSKRPSNGNLLRAVAAANAVGRRGTSISGSISGPASGVPSPATTSSSGTRPALASARKASEEARKALVR